MSEELKVLKCPSCGANAELDNNQDFGFCKYCGSKIERIKPTIQKIEITNPVKIDGKVQIVNNEFEVKLAKVNRLAEEFLLKKNKSESDALSIIRYYQYLDNVGENESKLWESFLEFFVKVNLDDKLLICKSVNEFEKKFYKIYNLVLKYEKNEDILKKVKEQYNPKEIINDFRIKLNNVPIVKKFFEKYFFWIFLSIPLIIFVVRSNLAYYNTEILINDKTY